MVGRGVANSVTVSLHLFKCIAIHLHLFRYPSIYLTRGNAHNCYAFIFIDQFEAKKNTSAGVDLM